MSARGFGKERRFSGHSFEISRCTVHPQANGMNPATRISSTTHRCSTAAFNHDCQKSAERKWHLTLKKRPADNGAIDANRFKRRDSCCRNSLLRRLCFLWLLSPVYVVTPGMDKKQLGRTPCSATSIAGWRGRRAYKRKVRRRSWSGNQATHRSERTHRESGTGDDAGARRTLGRSRRADRYPRLRRCTRALHSGGNQSRP